MKTINDIASELQADCHKFKEIIINKTKGLTNQDATNVWLYTKLAEFEIRLQQLEKIQISQPIH